MTICIGVRTEVELELDLEGFRGFSSDEIYNELADLVEAESGGEPNEEDLDFAVRQIEEALDCIGGV